jgi:hypothetical protein
MPTAAGPIAIPLSKLADLVAASSAFQERVDPDDPTLAKAQERIHWPYLYGDPLDAQRPFAVIESDGLKWEHVAGGAVNVLRPRGSLLLILQDNDRHPEEVKDSQVDFESFAGELLAQIAAAAGQGENLSITAIEQLGDATLLSPKDRPGATNFWQIVFKIDWGRV